MAGLGAVLGASYTAGGIGGLLGPPLAGWLVDATGSYTVAILAAAALGFWDAVAALERGEGRPVDLATGAYYRLPDDQSVKDFRRRGLRYV